MANFQFFDVAQRHVALAPATSFGKPQHRADDAAESVRHNHDVLGASDFADERADPAYLDLSREQEHAQIHHTVSEDVRREQAKLMQADLVIFQFPIWWFSMPAILKGWVDRVMARGFAYSAGHKYDVGLLRGKRAMLCITTGTADTLYAPNGIDGDLHHVLWPIHNGILAYTGFSVLPPFAAWMPGRLSAQQREQYLRDYAVQLARLNSVEPLFFHPRQDYDEHQQLKPDVVARSGVQWNPRAGQTFEQAAANEHSHRLPSI